MCEHETPYNLQGEIDPKSASRKLFVCAPTLSGLLATRHNVYTTSSCTSPILVSYRLSKSIGHPYSPMHYATLHEAFRINVIRVVCSIDRCGRYARARAAQLFMRTYSVLYSQCLKFFLSPLWRDGGL